MSDKQVGLHSSSLNFNESDTNKQYSRLLEIEVFMKTKYCTLKIWKMITATYLKKNYFNQLIHL